MKIVFLDKKKMFYTEIHNVVQVQRLPHWQTLEWMCITSTGERLGYNCKRFDLQRIDADEDK